MSVRPVTLIQPPIDATAFITSRSATEPEQPAGTMPMGKQGITEKTPQ